MNLPPETFVILADYGYPIGIGYHSDPQFSMDAAADQVGELRKEARDYPVRVLRIADSLNCDDVTADVFDILAARGAQYAAE